VARWLRGGLCGEQPSVKCNLRVTVIFIEVLNEQRHLLQRVRSPGTAWE
jgi:hypothetical protein